MKEQKSGRNPTCDRLYLTSVQREAMASKGFAGHGDRGTPHRHGPTNHFSPNTSLCTPHMFQHRGFACTVTTSTRTNNSESRVVQETARKSRGVNGCMVCGSRQGSPGENDDTGYCDTGSGLLDQFPRSHTLHRSAQDSVPPVDQVLVLLKTVCSQHPRFSYSG